MYIATGSVLRGVACRRRPERERPAHGTTVKSFMKYGQWFVTFVCGNDVTMRVRLQ